MKSVKALNDLLSRHSTPGLTGTGQGSRSHMSLAWLGRGPALRSQGFFQNPDIAREDLRFPAHGGANGIFDMIMALRW